jgi:hypothetical protein
MSETFEYDPDYIVSPACSFQEWLDINDFDVEEVCENVDHVKHVALAMLRDVLDLKPLSVRHANILSDVTGIPTQFWLNFEQNYRMGLELGKHDLSADILRRN